LQLRSVLTFVSRQSKIPLFNLNHLVDNFDVSNSKFELVVSKIKNIEVYANDNSIIVLKNGFTKIKSRYNFGSIVLIMIGF